MSGFLNRWSKRKAGLEADEPATQEKPKLDKASLAKGGQSSAVVGSTEVNTKPDTTAISDTTQEDAAKAEQAVAPEQATIPTLEDVLKLTKDSDFSAYVKAGIDPNVQQAALNKLFSDPHYNIMDGLDIYIDDYNKLDPMPLEMLKQLNQSKMLGLFKTPEEIEAELQAELIERREYKERLAIIDADEAEAAAVLKSKEEAYAREDAELKAKKEAAEAKAKIDDAADKDLTEETASLEGATVLPDENANGINAENLSELTNSQQTTNIAKPDSLLNKT